VIIVPVNFTNPSRRRISGLVFGDLDSRRN
jgi:hypothetical protein